MKSFTKKELEVLLDKISTAKEKLKADSAENSFFEENLLKILKESYEVIFSFSKITEGKD